MDYIWNIYSYFTELVKRIWWTSSSSTPENSLCASEKQKETSESSDKKDILVSDPPQTLLSGVQKRSSPVQAPVNTHPGHHDQPSILPQYSNSFSDHDQTAVEKINIVVKCAGKTTEVNIFPLERISLLLQEACDWAGKKQEKMSLVYDGNHLDVNKMVNEYGLRGGTTVNLIHV